MDQGFILSKKLLLSSIFGVLVVGGALYINVHKPVPLVPSAESTDTSTVTSTLDLANIPLNNPKNTVASTTEEAQLSETDILTRNTIGPYLKQARAGTYTPESGDTIVKNATKYMFTLDFAPLQPKDIDVLDATDAKTVADYKEALHTAVKPLFALKEYELTVYAKAIRDNSQTEFNKLSNAATVYKMVGDNVLKIKPPRDVSAVHLAIVNSLYKFSVILTELAKGYDDPAASLAGTGNFTTVEAEFTEAFDNLKTYFAIKNL